MRLVQTTRFRRGKLPHWEIENGRYFVTARLADSLPAAAVTRLHGVHQSLQAIAAQSSQFTQLQRIFCRDGKILGCRKRRMPADAASLGADSLRRITPFGRMGRHGSALHCDAEPLACATRTRERLLSFIVGDHETRQRSHGQCHPPHSRWMWASVATRVV